MSLLRLLTAGKTLIGLKRSESRYQLPGCRPLPMFGSKKNPFRATVFPDKPDSSPAPPLSDTASGTEPAASAGPDGLASENLRDLQPHQEHNPNGSLGVSGEEQKQDPQPKAQTQEAVPAKRTSAIRAFLLWRRVKKTSPQFAFKGRPLVQAELSLETVKVVRNDLSESDLEVVQVQVKRAAKEKSGTPQPPKRESAPATWSEAGAQLLSAGKL
jgi:hypothetical protein